MYLACNVLQQESISFNCNKSKMKFDLAETRLQCNLILYLELIHG